VGEVRKLILSGELAPGASLTETMLASMFGVARMRSTIGWRGYCSSGSAGLMANSRSGSPACSTRWISLVMNGSDARGKAFST